MAKAAPVRMTVDEVLEYLEAHGNEGGKTVLKRHGARDPFFGTRIADMKKLTRRIGRDHDLALALYETGNSDAMYVAGLIADETKITRKELQRWVAGAYWYLLAEGTVASVAAESPHGLGLAREWIDSPHEMVAAAGWSTYASLLSIGVEIAAAEVDSLLDRVERTIHGEQNRVRYAMNNFVISAGAYLPEYTDRAKALGLRIGKVTVDMGETECKVPPITSYVAKVEARGSIGETRSSTR